MTDRSEQIASAMRDFVPAPPEPPSEAFPPLLNRPERKVISTVDYKPAGITGVKLQGAHALQQAELDAAETGYRMVEHDEKSITVEHDPELAAQVKLRKGYQDYVSDHRHLHVFGSPMTPMEFVKCIAEGRDPIPPPPPPEVIDPAEKRLRDIEARLARIPQPYLPR
jgi:hypothetical protein